MSPPRPLASVRSDFRARLLRALGIIAAAALPCLLTCHARAGPPAPAEPDAATNDPALVKAREEFVVGAALVKQARWAEALATFERSSKLHRHAVTTYNIALCERALGRYAHAKQTFEQVLVQNAAAGGQELPASLVAEASGLLREIGKMLATVVVTLRPVGTAIAIDGRPLLPHGGSGTLPETVAGIRPPGPGEPGPAATFRVIIDPGTHVLLLSRRGFADSVVRTTVAPGSMRKLDLALDRLPATLRIRSKPRGAVVSVDSLDVGVTPVELWRPGGTHQVLIRKQGYLPFDSAMKVAPGEAANLDASLQVDTPSIVERWWFWTAIGAVVAGAAVTTYFLARTEPEPTRPPLNGGGLEWTVPIP